jgi:hypothetical protein
MSNIKRLEEEWDNFERCNNIMKVKSGSILKKEQHQEAKNGIGSSWKMQQH